MNEIKMPPTIFNGTVLAGETIEHITRTVAEIAPIFEAGATISSQQGAQTAYTVSSYLPETEGTHGGLYFGITNLFPGLIGDEYMMTKGHFHGNRDTSEFYWGIEGQGVLILMDENRNVWGERVFPGSLHYIPRNVAHRMANTGHAILSFGACWPSDAGHDYQSIADKGLAVKLKNVNGEPKLVKA